MTFAMAMRNESRTHRVGSVPATSGSLGRSAGREKGEGPSFGRLGDSVDVDAMARFEYVCLSRSVDMNALEGWYETEGGSTEEEKKRRDVCTRRSGRRKRRVARVAKTIAADPDWERLSSQED